MAISSLPILVKPLNLKNLLTIVLRSRYLASLFNYAGLPILKAFFGGKKFNPLSEIGIKRIDSFDDRFDAFGENACLKRNMTIRDKKYLTWRYIDKPNSNYIIYVAEKEGKVFGYIVLALR